ncbi:hypothetical protein BH10PSE2_BH10PSE2_00980 [soil metagenome]
MSIKPSPLFGLACVVAVGACTAQVKAPTNTGVCYAVVTEERGKPITPRFNVVATDQPQIEACAARLEEVRLRFLRMGGNQSDLTGSYQGQFIFIDRAGVWQAQTLDGPRFFALARTGDGRLAVPGTIERAPAS